jgi:uncharacterized phage-associated protein
MNDPVSPDVFSKALLQRAADQNIHMSHLKLQKLAYYCQGYHLAINNIPIFSGAIHAWDHGPVVAPLYGRYCMYKGSIIDVPDDRDYISDLSPHALKILDFVLNTLGSIGAWALRGRSHKESPWRSHYSEDTGRVDQAEITHEQLYAFFSQKACDIQDKGFASIMDVVDDEFIALPKHISDKDEFFTWIQSH